MNRRLPLLVALSLVLCFLSAAILRGAYERIYWTPVAGLLVAGAALFFLFNRQSFRLSGPAARPGLFLLAFIGWAGLASWFAWNREEALFAFVRLATLSLAYFLAAHGLFSRESRALLLFGFLAVFLLEALLGIHEFFTGKDLIAPFLLPHPHQQGLRPGTLINRNHFAGMMEMGLFLSLGLVRLAGRRLESKSEKWAQTLFFSIPPGVMALALVLSMSRGGWASAGAGLVFYFALLMEQSKQRTAVLTKSLVAVLVSVLVAAVFLFKVGSRPLKTRLQSIKEQLEEGEITANERISVWKSALAMTRDQPLTGVGPGGFKFAYPSYRKDRVIGGYAFAHNDYLQIMAETGIPGLIFFLLFLAGVFRKGFKTAQKPKSRYDLVLPGILAAIMSIMIHELVDFNLMLPANLLAFFSLCGFVAGSGETR